jgi:hypothetical protein
VYSGSWRPLETKPKQLLAGINVYDTYKHFRSVDCSKQSRYGDFLAVSTVSNGYILVISSQNVYSESWRPLETKPKQILAGRKLYMTHLNTLEVLIASSRAAMAIF